MTDDFTVGGGESTADGVRAGDGHGYHGQRSTLTWAAVCHARGIQDLPRGGGQQRMEAARDDPASGRTRRRTAGSATRSSNKDVTGGGALEQTYVDTGAAGTASAGPPAANEAVESALRRRTRTSIPAFEGVGIKYFGSDASKPYPNPAIPGSIEPRLSRRARRSSTGPAQAIPRYPTNIYYNASTEAQEVDEFNTLYTPVAEGGKCVASSDHHLRDQTGELRRNRQRRGHEHVPARDGQRPAPALLPPDEPDGQPAGRAAHDRDPRRRPRRASATGCSTR